MDEEASKPTVRVLNDLFTVLAYSGGAEDAEHGVEQVLKPTLRPCHCSGPGVGHTLDLGVASECEGVLLTHLAVHGAPGCSEPVKSGRVWLGESVAELEGKEPFLAFETDSVKAEWSTSLGKPVPARVVRFSFDSTHGEGDNVDVGMIALVGVSASDSVPDPSTCSSPIPAELKVRDLREVKKRKRWMPLESNPRVVSKYLKKLGFDAGYALHELMSLEPWALEMIPRPAQAIFLLFPIGKELKEARKTEMELPAELTVPSNVLHMKQTIGNACGTIAVIHAMGNLCRHGTATPESGSWLERFLANYKDGMTSDDVGTMLEEDAAIEAAHKEAEAESEANRSHATNANLHFIAFVNIDGLVVELDGCAERPIVRSRVSDFGGDFLSAAVTTIRSRYMELSPDALRFNMMALCGGSGCADGAGYSMPAPAAISEEAVQQLMGFGFEREAAQTALEAMGGNVEAAANMLLG
eukprot:TRINITY_DN1651_c0_g2_i1.p1 TRINITY_DN1651_c0_g2~~TRINITY_DN1651_c0_g2_i1.p1  ORF type:complete len:469 (+),score=110.36 TRINITY_DN1651_c0_g2_i1:48-1454(+)